jgi:hypothetical protein
LPPGAATGCSGCRSRQHMQVVQLGPPHAIADVQRPAGRPGDLVSGPLVGYVLRPVGVLCRSRPLVRPGPRPPDQLRTRTRQFALTAESACRRSRSSCKATNPQNAARCAMTFPQVAWTFRRDHISNRSVLLLTKFKSLRRSRKRRAKWFPCPAQKAIHSGLAREAQHRMRRIAVWSCKFCMDHARHRCDCVLGQFRAAIYLKRPLIPIRSRVTPPSRQAGQVAPSG